MTHPGCGGDEDLDDDKGVLLMISLFVCLLVCLKVIIIKQPAIRLKKKYHFFMLSSTIFMRYFGPKNCNKSY